jgi:hypothetical protein
MRFHIFWTMFANHVKSLIIFTSQMGFFRALTKSMWWIEILINIRLEMKGDQHCELGQHIKSISTTYLDDWWYQIPSAFWNEKYFLSYCVYHKYTHGFLNLMVHSILQIDLHGFKAFVSSNLTIIFVPPNVTTIVPKQF